MKKLREEIEKIVKHIAYGAGDSLGIGYEEDINQLLSLFKKWTKKVIIVSFKKGYFKGVLDGEHGQVTSKELLGKDKKKT